MLSNFFERYEALAKKADHLFKTTQEQCPACVQCRIHCYDCCYAVFGVFPIEAAYLHYHFNHLEMRVKTETLRRGEKTESGMLRVRDKLGVFDHDPKMKLYGLGKQRIACPFLDNKKECVIYKRRPIICRIYGVPFRVRDGKKEKVYVCGFSGFLKGINYPTVKLDEIYHELYQLSKEVLTKANSTYLERAALMLSLPKVLKTPLEAIIKGDFVD